MHVQLRLLGVLLVAGLAVAAGMWVATLTAPEHEPLARAIDPPPAPQSAEASPPLDLPPDVTPAPDVLVAEPLDAEPIVRATPNPKITFFAGLGEGSDSGVVGTEIVMAAQAGVEQFIFAPPFPWDDAWEAFDAAMPLVLSAKKLGQTLIWLDLNPSSEWLAAHPDEVGSPSVEGRKYPSIGSRVWLDAAAERIRALREHLHDRGWMDSVDGWVLGALEDGFWYRRDGPDTSVANVGGFRAWLETRYESVEALQEAWGDSSAGFDTAAIPKALEGEGPDVFFALPEMGRRVDFQRYLSAATAGAIAELAGVLREPDPSQQILVPYGFAFGLGKTASGHCGLGDVLASDIDGLISPVRLPGGAGDGLASFLGPFESARNRGKQWYLYEDASSGLGPDTGETRKDEPPIDAGARESYRLSLSVAAIHGLGVIWADAMGAGNLNGWNLWDGFSEFTAVHAQAAEHAGGTDPGAPVLAIVVDEESRFFQRLDEPLNEWVLGDSFSAALGAGVATRIILLSDLLEDRCEAASIYLFLNAFQLSEAERDKLHSRLEAEKSAAIWLYAPGYIEAEADVSQVAKTTGMKVKSFGEPKASGSTFSLSGNWISKGDTFGVGTALSPMFYVEDMSADTLAQYTGSERVSAAIRFSEDSWTSVYICEPILDLRLLREIIDILEFNIVFRSNLASSGTLFQQGRGLLLLRSGSDGEAVLELGAVSDVSDLFDSRIGWRAKNSISVPLVADEIRLFGYGPPR